MNIGITGANDFLGIHTLNRLKNNPEVNGVEIFEKSGSDILNKKSVEVFVSGKDVIIHLAAVHRAEDIELMRTNLLGTLSLVKAIKETNPDCRLLFSSSFQVYANSTKEDVIGEDFPLGPTTTYGFSKKFEEELILSNVKDSAVFRISNVYGPGCRPFDNSVVATFIHLAKEGKEIIVTGSGDQSKDFVFVDDVVDAFELAVFSKEKGIFNICTGESVSINRLVGLLNKDFPRLKVARRTGEDGGFSTRGSCKKAEKIIKWKPRTLFEDGLKKCE